MGGFGEGHYLVAPPPGPSLHSRFAYIGEPGNLFPKIDADYSNVAIITADKTEQYGAMWAVDKIDLRRPFSFEMNLFMHYSEDRPKPDPRDGVADGMAFVFQNAPEGTGAFGGKGEGLGVYRGYSQGASSGEHIKNSLAIEFDTWWNGWLGTTENLREAHYVFDPLDSRFYAHCAWIIPEPTKTGTCEIPWDDLDVPIGDDLICPDDHKDTFNYEPVQEWIPFSARWEPEISGGTAGGTLTYFYDVPDTPDKREVAIKLDDVTTVFGGTSVYWGFTAATGGACSVQAVAITRWPDQTVTATKAADKSLVTPGETFQYTITVVPQPDPDQPGVIEQIGPIEIEDALPEYLEYVGDTIVLSTNEEVTDIVEYTMSAGGVMNVETGVYFTEVDQWLEITFNVRVKDTTPIGTKIINKAVIKATNGLTSDKDTNETEVSVYADPEDPVKTVSDASAAGQNESSVKPGDEITYEITYFNHEDTPSTIVITDVLDQGVAFVAATNDGTYDSDTHTVTWTLENVPSGAGGSVSLTVVVSEDAVVKVENSATVTVGDNEPQVTNKVTNPVKRKGCLKQTTRCRRAITGRKIWDDNDNTGNTRPLFVEIVLRRDGEDYQSVRVGSTGNGTFTFGCLPIWRNSEQKYNYQIDETDVPGYTKTIEGYIVTNTLTP